MRAQRWLVASTVLALAACTAEPGSARWCSAKKEQSKTEWSIQDATTFAAHCLLDDTTVGGEAWCTRLAARPKGEWSADEAASYARHCLL